MPSTDALIARYSNELDDRRTFQESILATADEEGRDVRPEEMEMYKRATTRMSELEGLLEPLREGARIATESRARTQELMSQFTRNGGGNGNGRGGPPTIEYRSAGAFIADLYLGSQGNHDAAQRVELFTRAAAHQTTADNPGLLPESIVEPVIIRMDAARPLVTAIGPRDLGAGSWSYARVTQHTQVAQQAGEKQELASRKLTITKTPISGPTYGGYLNVSKQDISRTSPQIVDMVLDDLAAQYGIATEAAAGAAIDAAATAGPTLPATPTGADVSAALWAAAGQAYSAVPTGGRLIAAVSPDMLGLVGPLFAPYNPANAFGTGFNAGSFGQGVMGAVSGISVVMSTGLPPGTIDVINTEAVRVYEARYEAMQVGEPSVWGVQVGYAGDFTTLILDPAGIISVTITP